MSAAILLGIAALLIAVACFEHFAKFHRLSRHHPRVWPFAVLVTLVYGVTFVFLASAAVHCVSAC